MYSDPKTLAKSALELLRLSYIEGTPASTIASLEFGAVVMCSHVWDWHERTHAPSDRARRTEACRAAGLPTPSRDELSAQFRSDFAKHHPEWDLLRQVANGLKHAKSFVLDPARTTQRKAAWGDYDWWSATHGVPTLFVEVEGRQQSVSALVRRFVRTYLADDAASDVERPSTDLAG